MVSIACAVLCCSVAAEAAITRLPLEIVAPGAGTRTPTGELAIATVDAIVEIVDGQYFVPAEDLRGIDRLMPDVVPKVARDGKVKLSDIGRVTFDEAQSQLQLQIRPELLKPQVLTPITDNLYTRIPTAMPMQHAALIDYDLRAELGTDHHLRTGAVIGASAYVDITRFDLTTVLDTAARVSDPRNIVTYARVSNEYLFDSSLAEFGNIVTSSGSRNAPTSIVGFGLRRDRGIMPGFITGPQLRIDGVATARSTVDVLLDGQRLQASGVAPGPFSVVANPPSTGAGTASVVVRDQLGYEHVTTQTLYADPQLLGVGQYEYAVSFGGVSLGSGLRAGMPAGGGYYRRGITNWLTMEAGAEASAASAQAVRHVSVGADIGTVVGDFALDYRTQRDSSRSSSVTYLAPRTKLGAWEISAAGSSTVTSAGYRQLDGSTPARYSRSASIFGMRGGGDLSVNASFAATPAGQFGSLGLARRISNAGAMVQVSATRFVGSGASSNAIYLSLSIPLNDARGSQFSASASGTAGGIRKSINASSRISDNWSASISADGVHDLSERLQADLGGSIGDAAASVQVAGDAGQPVAARAMVRGGLLIHPGGVTSMRAAGDGGFAVFDLGAPGVGVTNGFGGLAITDASGYAVLPLQPMQQAHLVIDPNNSPDGLDLSPVVDSVRRRGGILISRRPVHGQFIQFGQADGVLVVNGTEYPVTDRGAYVELAPGSYAGHIGTRVVKFEVKK